MIYSKSNPYYSTSTGIKLNDLVVVGAHRKWNNPTICRVVSSVGPLKPNNSMYTTFVLECINTKIVTQAKGLELIKYDAYLIMSILRMQKKLIKACSDVDTSQLL